MAGQPDRTLRGTSPQGVTEAIRNAIHGAPGRPGERATYVLGEIAVDASFRSPGVVDVYRVRLDKV
jgi:flavin-binding protein dodecin